MRLVLLRATRQRDAAAAAQLSERTLRNLLQRVRRSGLDGLRSHATAGRRAPHRRVFEQALRAALAEAPESGGDRLWRRAQALLEPHGSQLSRRTAYRLLAQLRAVAPEQERDDAALAPLRQALGLLLEDPPLTLGASSLAQRLLPAQNDTLLRGRVLQTALHTALDRLRPDGAINTVDREWWPYLVCTGEYESSQRRAELQKDLALSASTYTRAKRQGLERISTWLPQLVEAAARGMAPAVAAAIPRVPDFVGRGNDQLYYSMRLQEDGLALIWGLPGSGKSALAAELAASWRRYGQLVLWHTCRAGPDASVDGIVRGLASELASQGRETLWHQVRAAGGEEPPDQLVDRLIESLAGGPTVIVLDDVQRARLNPAFDQLLERLHELIQQRSLRLLLVGQENVSLPSDWAPLHGMVEAEARVLLGFHSGTPTPEGWMALYQATDGLPGPLRAAARTIRQGERLTPDMWAPAVEAYAREAIWDWLSDGQQALLAVLASLDEAPGVHGLQALLTDLALGMDDLLRMLRRSLLLPDGHRLRPPAMLSTLVSERLLRDPELRALVEAYRRRPIAEADLPPADLPPAPPISAILTPAPLLRSALALDPAAPLRNLLLRTLAYLRRSSDPTARTLAAEIEEYLALPIQRGSWR